MLYQTLHYTPGNWLFALGTIAEVRPGHWLLAIAWADSRAHTSEHADADRAQREGSSQIRNSGHSCGSACMDWREIRL